MSVSADAQGCPFIKLGLLPLSAPFRAVSGENKRITNEKSPKLGENTNQMTFFLKIQRRNNKKPFGEPLVGRQFYWPLTPNVRQSIGSFIAVVVVVVVAVGGKMAKMLADISCAMRRQRVFHL